MALNNYTTDLQVAEELENLVNVISESIERAERTLEKAKEIDEVKKLINEIYCSREELHKAEESLRNIENTSNILLAEAQSIEQDLQDLKLLPEKLIKLGITESVLPAIQLIFDDVNSIQLATQKSIEDTQNILLEAKNNLGESKKILRQSEQIKEDFTTLYNDSISSVEDIEIMAATSSKNLMSAQEVIQDFNLILERIGGVEQVKVLLEEVEKTRVELQKTKDELHFAKQNLHGITALDDYINNFQNIRSRKQLWQLLRKELGFVGIVIYLLTLIIPIRRR